MATRRLGTHDRDTGEVLDGVAVWVGRKIVSPYGSQWMQVNQDALAEIDLASKGLAWNPDILHNREFQDLVAQVKDKFQHLK